MKPLTKPFKGIQFWLMGILFDLNWAKSGTWAVDEQGKRTVYLIGAHLTKKEGDERMLYCVSLFILPVKIMIGFKGAA